MVAGGEFRARHSRGLTLLQAGAVALALCAVAAVLVAQGGADAGDVLLQTKLNTYLGDSEALSATDARKQSDAVFDSLLKKQQKSEAKHRAHAEGMSSTAARQDMMSFFDTLGLKKAKKAKPQVITVKEVKKAPTTVNVYINEHGKKPAPSDIKKVVQQAVAAKRVAKKARELQLAQTPHVSKFEREMAEAKALLHGSKDAKALSEARTLSLASAAPYYTA